MKPNAKWERIGPDDVDRLAYAYQFRREIIDIATFSRGIGATMVRGFALSEALKQFPPALEHLPRMPRRVPEDQPNLSLSESPKATSRQYRPELDENDDWRMQEAA